MNGQIAKFAPRSIYSRQVAGFSMIELMIAIVVTLFLVGGMLAVISSMKASFTTQDKVGQLSENELFGLTVLDNTVRQAGYFSDAVNTSEATAFPTTTQTSPKFITNQFIAGTKTLTDESLAVRFRTAPSDGLMNCLGEKNTTLSPITWTNTFTVDSSSHQLTCTVSRDDVAASADATAVPLIDNVATMAVLYGIANTTHGSADTYVAGSALPPAAQVVSVQLTITLLDLVNSKTVNLTHPIVHNINLMNTR
jgi:type IV pilus assembly protein PilW